MVESNAIKNIILDLGGVIINIDYHRTSEAFNELGISNFDDFYSQKEQISLFTDYETGVIDDTCFRGEIRNVLKASLTDQQIDHAWNAMLLDIPSERIEFLSTLSNKYRLFLYSNTNRIHMRAVKKKLAQLTDMSQAFDKLFEKTYYSHEFHYRKPHPESFKKILELNSLKSTETLFVDDSLQHVIGARDAGLEAIHLTNPHTLVDLEALISEE